MEQWINNLMMNQWKVWTTNGPDRALYRIRSSWRRMYTRWYKVMFEKNLYVAVYAIYRHTLARYDRSSHIAYIEQTTVFSRV